MKKGKKPTNKKVLSNRWNIFNIKYKNSCIISFKINTVLQRHEWGKLGKQVGSIKMSQTEN